MMTEKGCRKDKNQNIQVFVRLRPLNQRERDIKSLGAVEVVNNREVVVRQSQQTSHTKKFTFDRAFAPYSKQIEVYQDVVSPLIEEVLAGYNCTVFAYGQTGTGKTHTMVGEHSGDEMNWQSDPLAGIIPRALSQLFDELRLTNTEYTVRVSYLELYNEELFDLLASTDDNSKLRIYEDVTRKGSNIVNGLEEITVYNKNEVYKIMAQGQERKKVASTLMNAQSSRSHTVFTIVVHMKENSPEGEELVKIGKLNLVDLAGSENISKAGSDNPAKRERARECVNINQSLLTLGRVITALVERHPHIPYRESKLTRILQESLGGRTKTSIIATISPGHKDVEETLSTLEYAHRAKNIQNKPEINQKLTKKAILKEYAEEIDRLKRDLQACRDKNGVYLANETYTELTLKQEEQRKEIQELILKKRALEDERDKMEGVFAELNQQLEQRVNELNSTTVRLNDTQAVLHNTSNMLRRSELQVLEQRHLVSVRRHTEEALGVQAREILAAADTAAGHVGKLHDSVDRRRTIESTNLQLTAKFREQSSAHRELIACVTRDTSQSVCAALQGLRNDNDNFASTLQVRDLMNKESTETIQAILTAMNELISQNKDSLANITQMSEEQTELREFLSVRTDNIQSLVNGLVSVLNDAVDNTSQVDVKGNMDKFVQQWFTSAVSRVKSLQSSTESFSQRVRNTQSRRAARAHKHIDEKITQINKKDADIKQSIENIELEKSLIENRLSKQLADIETERKETEIRLQRYVEEERRLLEERLDRYVQGEKEALEKRLSTQIKNLEEERQMVEEIVNKLLRHQQEQLEANKAEIGVIEEEMKLVENDGEETVTSVNSFAKNIDDGTTAVRTEMETFSVDVVEEVRHLTDQLARIQRDAATTVQQEAQQVMSVSSEINEQTPQIVGKMTQNMLTTVLSSMERVDQSIQNNTKASVEHITKTTTQASDLVSCCESHLNTQTDVIRCAERELMESASRVQEEVQKCAETERVYLMQEYTVYQPSGETPARCEYRYPRTLAATSPHERILARFRAARQNSADDDCVVLESDSSGRVSDSESSVSEDSAVAFAVPSPPTRPPTNPPADSNKTPHIVKCTSETDIYRERRRQELGNKENLTRSVSHKKPSKLPAPSSLKKPFAERNTDQ